MTDASISIGTTIFVASNGGHLTQLHQLAQRMTERREERLWVSFDGPQVRSLLAGEQTILIPYIGTRSLAGVVQGINAARRVFAAAAPVRAVISTGSGIALSFLPYAVMRRIEAHYIESAARVGAISMTGKILSRVPGIRLYRQYPEVVCGRWNYGGSVFDGYEPVPVETPRIRRVVVTVGSDRSFLRLLQACANLLPPDLEVVWQSGPTDTRCLPINPQPYIPALQLTALVRDADVVIAHAGCGSALMALQAGKCPILVPRDPAYAEVVDDHQHEVADWLSARGLAIKRNVEDLRMEDLGLAAGRRIARTLDLPRFELRRAA